MEKEVCPDPMKPEDCVMPSTPRIEELKHLLARRIVVLDGAMGTMIQKRSLSEADFEGSGLPRIPVT